MIKQKIQSTLTGVGKLTRCIFGAGLVADDAFDGSIVIHEGDVQLGWGRSLQCAILPVAVVRLPG